MNAARADALAARHRLASRGWIARTAESFRHLPPPPADVWLGAAVDAGDDCDAHPLDGAGWTLHPVGRHRPVGVDARWLDATDATQRAELFAGLPLPGDGEAAPFAWAHRALCVQGLRLRVGADHDAGRPVWVQLRRRPRSAVEAPLLVVDLEPGAHAVLVETHEREGSACGRGIVQNLHLHLRLGPGATLRHLRVVMPAAGDHVAQVVHARLDRGARYDQALIACGSAYHLQRNAIALDGEDASVRTSAVLFAAGTTLEQQSRIDHAAARSTSAVDGLVLAGGAARAVLGAHGHIAEGCGGARAHQRLAGVPTGGQPRLVLRPHFEILHDDVQASHGATWGALPEDALFYAAQRGIDEARARALIVEGMAAAVLARAFDDPTLPQQLGLETLLARAAAAHLARLPERHDG